MTKRVALVRRRNARERVPHLGMSSDAREIPDPLDGRAESYWIAETGGVTGRLPFLTDDEAPRDRITGMTALAVTSDHLYVIVGPDEETEPAAWISVPLGEVAVSADSPGGRRQPLRVDVRGDGWELRLDRLVRLHRSSGRYQTGQERALVQALTPLAGVPRPEVARATAPTDAMDSPSEPPTGEGTPRSRAVLLGVSGLVVAAATVTVVAVAASGDDSGSTGGSDVGAAATPSDPGTTAVPTTAAGTTPSEPVPGPPGTADDLLALLPDDLVDCRERAPFGDGDIAAVECGGGSSAEQGPEYAQFVLFPNRAAMDAAWTSGQQQLGLEYLDPDSTARYCGGSHEGYHEYADGPVDGLVGCWLSDGLAQFTWTENESLVIGNISTEAATQESLSSLAQWWGLNRGLASG